MAASSGGSGGIVRVCICVVGDVGVEEGIMEAV